MSEDEIEFANRILSLKTGEPILPPKKKLERIMVAGSQHQSNVYAELEWNRDGTLSTLQIADRTLHFVWNADGTLHSIRRG